MSSEDKIIHDELWCFRSETAKLLGLSVTQIHTSLTDGDNSVGTLTDSFQQLADFCSSVQQLSADNRDNEDAQSQINTLATNMSATIDNAIVAFQFYDRLSQRMAHVSSSLDQLSHLIKDDENLNDPIGWKELRDHIKSSYSLDAEHVMYEAIMSGATAAEALKLYNEKMHESDASDDIELF
jgi:uncharacterized protein YoxC